MKMELVVNKAVPVVCKAKVIPATLRPLPYDVCARNLHANWHGPAGLFCHNRGSGVGAVVQ